MKPSQRNKYRRDGLTWAEIEKIDQAVGRGESTVALKPTTRDRLVAEGCDGYTTGPGPEWRNEDRASYRLWQRKLGYRGDDADGWPGKASWDQLKVPRVTPVEVESFPGERWFKKEPKSPIVTAMGKRLVAQGCGEYTGGPGPQWTDADRDSYRNWQRQCGYSGEQLDGWPEKETWEKLVVPKTED